MANWIITWFYLTLTSLMTLTSGNVMQYSIGDVYAELQSWGNIVVGRYNDSNMLTQDLEYSRLKLKVTDIRLLDEGHKVMASHKFDATRYQEYRIHNWEGATYASLGASGRRMTSVSLGDDVTGTIDLRIYVFTEKGKLSTIWEDYRQHVDARDVLIVAELRNVTQCETCRDDVAFVDLRMQVIGTSDIPIQVTMDEMDTVQLDTIHIPASAFITISNKVTLDGVHGELERGYPEVEEESEGVDLIIRFPMFAYSASYGLFVKQDRRSPEQVRADVDRGHVTNHVVKETSVQAHSSGQQRISHLSFIIFLTLKLHIYLVVS